MDDQTLLIFLGLVFGAVLLLAQSIFVPTFGTARQESKRLRKRLGTIEKHYASSEKVSLLREKYLRGLSPFERGLESLPGMQRAERLIEQSGHAFPAYRLVLLSVGLGIVGGVVAWLITRHPLVAMFGTLIPLWLPFKKLTVERDKRFAKFEEQLPEALEVMTRALRAGHPFNETLRIVSEEMDDPLAREFGLTFDEINYGGDVRFAMQSLLDRVPSLSLMAVVTSVLVQRETGGNLAEILQNISGVVRGRFRFQRRVRTLTAEGRLSAWILTLIPFVLFGIMAVVTPDYAMALVKEPGGLKLVFISLVLIFIGAFWIRKMLRIDV